MFVSAAVLVSTGAGGLSLGFVSSQAASQPAKPLSAAVDSEHVYQYA